MSNTEKCFCHLNGYKVKDADARAGVEILSGEVEGLKTTATGLATEVEGLKNSAGSGGGKLYQHNFNYFDSAKKAMVIFTLYLYRDTAITILSDLINCMSSGSSTVFRPYGFIKTLDAAMLPNAIFIIETATIYQNKIAFASSNYNGSNYVLELSSDINISDNMVEVK